MDKITWVDAATAIAQVIFWITIATVTVLTFLHARRTVLQPLRTEVFKLQLEEMREVLRLFVGRTESELRDDAHLSEMFDASAALMYDAYAEARFPVKVKKEGRPYTKYKNWKMRPEALELANDDVTPSPSRDSGAEAAWKQRPWADYQHLGLPIPDGLLEYMAKIQRLIESPILPTACAELLEEYLQKLADNQTVIGKVVERAAREMPARYDSLDRLQVAQIHWMVNLWNGEVIDLKPTADKVTAFARMYFKSDEFIRAAKGRDAE